jgi:hypothetical protein
MNEVVQPKPVKGNSWMRGFIVCGVMLFEHCHLKMNES